MQRFEHRPPPHPARRQEAIAAVGDLLQHGDWTRLEGAPELEADLARWHGPGPRDRDPLVWYVASGTAALEAIMLGHGIGPGDEVITTPYTWAATTAAILAIGAIPVFADIDLATGLIDPTSIQAQISPRTRAVLVVHLFGQACDCRRLRVLCDEHHLLLLEDGSQAHGARFGDRLVGDWGDAAAFSCMGLKLLGGTEGGYAVFRDAQAAEAAYLYGKHPRGLPDAQAEKLTEAGLLDALQLGWRPCIVGAELIRHNLPSLEDENAARRQNAQQLRRRLSGSKLRLPDELPGATGCYHLLSLMPTDDCPHDKATLLARLQKRGVEAFDYIPTPLHRLRRLNPHDYQGPRVFWHDQLRRAGVDYRQTRCPMAEERCRRSIEMAWNWTQPDPAAMDALANCLIEAADE